MAVTRRPAPRSKLPPARSRNSRRGPNSRKRSTRSRPGFTGTAGGRPCRFLFRLVRRPVFPHLPIGHPNPVVFPPQAIIEVQGLRPPTHLKACRGVGLTPTLGFERRARPRSSIIDGHTPATTRDQRSHAHQVPRADEEAGGESSQRQS